MGGILTRIWEGVMKDIPSSQLMDSAENESHASPMLYLGTFLTALVFPYSLFNCEVAELGTGTHPKVRT